MPKLLRTTPKYRHHKASGQAIVSLNGKYHYLGPWKSKASQIEYDRLIGEWLAAGRRLASTPDSDLTVNEMLLAYNRFVESYYRFPDGGQTDECRNIKLAMKPLRALYQHTLACDFGPLALKVVRERMIRSDLCRNEINKRVRRVIRAFKWAVENQLVPSSVYQGLKAVAGLRRGRSDARESEPVKPVPEAFVDAVRPFMLPPVWAMIQLQRLTGMRPGEVVSMRGADLDTRDNVWVYSPQNHKTAYHGHARQIFIGPKAQQVLRPWLKTDLQAYLFSPAVAMRLWNAERRQSRRTPMTPSQAKRRPKRRPRKTPGDCYTREAYTRAIAAACKKADAAAHKANRQVAADQVLVPHWHPHQLRHNAATWIRREFGLDVARVILGHRSPAVTEVYAEVDFHKAINVMAQVG